MIPFLPYRTMRDHFLDYPLGANVLTILLIAVIVGAIIHGKRLPKSKLYPIWLLLGIYLYFSMWIGTAMGNAPAPLWLSDLNFVTWKDYMLIPLVFVAAGLVIEDRKAIRTVIILTAFAVLFIDRSCLFESMTRTWTNFDENKRDSGPLGLMAQTKRRRFWLNFACSFGALRSSSRERSSSSSVMESLRSRCLRRCTRSPAADMLRSCSASCPRVVEGSKAPSAPWDLSIDMGSRRAYRRPSACYDDFQNSSGRLEASAQERVDLWKNAEESFLRSPIVGNGFATFQLEEHVGDLRDTHNWYVKVLVETGILGLILVVFMLQQMLATSYRLFKRASDPLYRGLGLGLFVRSVLPGRKLLWRPMDLS